MKNILLTFLLLLSLAASGAGVQWNNYPTTNTMGTTDTLLIGNGGTNATITRGGLSSAIGLTNQINTSSNTLYGTALTQINTSSNLVYQNILFPATNAFAGAVVDFSKSDWTTNLSGALTITGVANLLAGSNNAAIIHMQPGGSDRVIAVPASWHIAYGNNMVVSNAFNHSDFLFTCQPGLNTNVAEIDYP